MPETLSGEVAAYGRFVGNFLVQENEGLYESFTFGVLQIPSSCFFLTEKQNKMI